jgi:hypothetical protein
MTFYLFKIAIHGVSLWQFHVYMHYNPNCFISIFLLPTLDPLLLVISTGLKIQYRICIESISTIFTFLTFSFYLPFLICDLPLEWPVFHNTGVFVLGLHYTYERKYSAFGLLNLANFT